MAPSTPWMRLHLSATVGLCIAATLLAGCGVAPDTGPTTENQQGSATNRPLNVVFVQWDATRGDTIRALGTGLPEASTPVMAEFAEQAVLFDQAIVNAPYTASSVPSLMTGNYQDIHGLRYQGTRTRPEAVMLAERLSEAGYDTAGFVANGVLGPRSSVARGFETYLRLKKGKAPAIVDAAIDWLGERRQEPFFLWVFLVEPHFPYNPPEEFRGDSDSQRPYEDSFSWKRVNERPPSFSIEDLYWGKKVTKESRDQEWRLYQGEISYSDQQTGRLLERLSEMGLDENTLVVFTSDHGEEFGEHDFYFCHGYTVYEPVVRVPLIVRSPSLVRPGRVESQVVRMVDIAPTVLDYLELPSDQVVDGRSLRPLVEGEVRKIDPIPAYFESAPLHEGFFEARPRIYQSGPEGSWRGIRTEHWKLIKIPRPEGPEYELYDVRKDPGETTDLSALRPRVLKQLKEQLEEIERRTMGLDGHREAPELDDETERILRSLGYIAS